MPYSWINDVMLLLASVALIGAFGFVARAVFTRKRVRRKPLLRAGYSVAGLVLVAAIGGLPAVIIAVLAARRWRGRVDLAVPIALLICAASVGAALPLPFDRTTWWTPFGDAVTGLTVIALALLASTAALLNREAST